MQSSLPSISVILPVYNAERFVVQAVRSVLNQTLSSFELLILDDGSTDNSLRLLRELEAQDARVKVFSRENRGLISTLNELILKAQSPYVARMDADDICVDCRLEKQASFLDMNPDHVVVGSWIVQINEVGLPIGTIRSPLTHQDIDLTHLRGHAAIAHPSAMIRRSALLAVAGYCSDYPHAEDLDLWLRLADYGKLANLSVPLLLYRIHDKSVSQINGPQQQSSAQRACEAAWARRGIAGHFEATDLWRGANSRQSKHQFAIRYGWTAWANGYRATWLYYTIAALRLRPFHYSSWKLLLFGLRTAEHSSSGNRSIDGI